MKNTLARLAIAATALISSYAISLAETTALNFGIISTESTQALKSKWEPFLAAMEKETGIKVQPFFASDYAGVIEGMKFNKVQAAWFGNKAAMEAVDRAEGQVFAQTVNDDGTQGYYSVLITQADNAGINTVDDVLKCDKSISFGNGDPNSTSGFLVPSVYVFSAKGIEPKDCFKTVTNANHETNAMAVANGQVEVATNNTENLAILAKEHPDDFKKLKVIWKSPIIPSDPIVWRKDLDPEAKGKLMVFFMGYGRQGSPEEVQAARGILKELGWSPFRPSSDGQLYTIRVLETVKKINKVSTDANLSQADKDAQLKDLMAEKAKWEQLADQSPNS